MAKEEKDYKEILKRQITFINECFEKQENISLEEIVSDACLMLQKNFPKQTEAVNTLCRLLQHAVLLAKEEEEDIFALEELGEGWIAEETLAVSVYTAIKYQNDFYKAILCAVNHDGDSDSTGSLTGQILGAYLGFDDAACAFDITPLEEKDTILEIAHDLYFGTEHDPNYEEKYVSHTYRNDFSNK